MLYKEINVVCLFRHAQRTFASWSPSEIQAEAQHLPFTDLEHTKAL